MLLAGGIPDPHAASLDHDPGVDRLERLVLDQMVPDMRPVGFDDSLDIIGLDGQIHDRAPPGNYRFRQTPSGKTIAEVRATRIGPEPYLLYGQKTRMKPKT